MDPADLDTSPQMFTTHGTRLFFDPSSGQLRHGTAPASAAKSVLTMSGGRATLVCQPTNGAAIPIVVNTNNLALVRAFGPEPPMELEVVHVDQQWVGLRHRGRFLSAWPDGTVRLSAEQCCNWEQFVLADPLPPLTEVSSGFVSRQPSLSVSCIETRPERLLSAAAAVIKTTRLIRTRAVYWFSPQPFPARLLDVKIINIPIDDFADFNNDINRICLNVMPRIVDSDFNLIVQDHAFAVNPQAWDLQFWDYDYIGAPFCGLWGGGPYWRSPIVGNGGFSLRSRKLNEALVSANLRWRVTDWVDADPRARTFPYYVTDKTGERCFQEDITICIWARRLLEREYGIKFCPPELAAKFSLFEAHPLTNYWVGKSFGFHGEGIAPHYGVEIDVDG